MHRVVYEGGRRDRKWVTLVEEVHALCRLGKTACLQ